MNRKPAGLKSIKRHTTPGTPGTSYGLPEAMLQTAVQRLGFLALIVALMGPSVWLAESMTQPERVAASVAPVSAALLFLSGAAMFALAWSGRVRTSLVLDLGLVFEVVVALLVSIYENATPWPPGPVRGLSWTCLWISMYVVAIPGTYGKNVLAVIAAAFMSPIGLMAATVINGASLPEARQLVPLLLMPFVTAAWAIPVARHFYRLGTQVTRAQAMGSYELIELIGLGGMGEVWRARHRLLTRISALKLIRPEALTINGADLSEVLLRRFEREARATAALRSPHTVALFDYGRADDGRFFYAMELLEGLDLETLVRRFGPVPAGRAVHLLSQAAKSLEEAHGKNLVHRDIKPRNIFTCRMGAETDFVKVLDFGLVKQLAAKGETLLTREGAAAGTPAYMAPEVALGRPDVDGRSDLYSLGCVAYWLVTGQLVFEEDSPMATAFAHVQARPLPPSVRTEMKIPESLDRLILQCLEKDPARRPQTARELRTMLERCQGVDSWTERDAERWWELHVPPVAPGDAAVIVDPELETQ